MRKRRELGFSMLEILVAVMIIALALVGLAGLQVRSVQNNLLAAERSLVVMQINSLIERMRANPQVDKTQYNFDSAGAAPGCTNTAAANYLSRCDLVAWLEGLQANGLGDAESKVECRENDSRYDCSFTLRWASQFYEDDQQERLSVHIRSRL